MSRTVSEGLKVTRLDTDIFFDRKIKRLCRLCDENAPMVYIGLLCLIGKDGYYIEWNKDTMLDVAEMLRKDEEYIDKAVNACIEAELFSKEMYDQYGILTSHGIQEQYNFVKATAKSKIRVSMYSLLQNEESSDKKAITSERKSKTSEFQQQIKEKETIEEKSKQTKNIHSSYCLPKEKEQQEEIIVSYFFFEKNFQQLFTYIRIVAHDFIKYKVIGDGCIFPLFFRCEFFFLFLFRFSHSVPLYYLRI